jgi:hypothetical protein
MRHDRNRIHYSRISDPIVIGQRTIRTVARVKGWRGARGRDLSGTVTLSSAGGPATPGQVGQPWQGHGDGAGIWLHVIPAEVIVRDSDGDPYIVPIGDPTADALRGMLRVALGIGAACWLLGCIVTLGRGRIGCAACCKKEP